jgi:hypothetical protein
MKVTTSQLSPDAVIADPSFGHVDRGEMSATEVEALLARFSQIDASQNQRHDPHVIVRVRDESHLIRASRGQLLLYNARDVLQPGVKMTLRDLMAVLEGMPAGDLSPDATESAVAEGVPPPPRRKYHELFALVLLVAGLGMNLWALGQWLLREKPPEPEYTPISDPAQLAELRRQVTGVYTTGPDAGSRVMTIKADDGIEFALMAKDSTGALQQIRRFKESFVWSKRRDGSISLATARTGYVELGPDHQPRFYGDTYVRIADGTQH